MLSLLYPHTCAACHTDVLHRQSEVCPACQMQLPETGFTGMPDNPVEQLFWGRLPLTSATSLYYFQKGSTIQTLLHAIKYDGNKRLAHQLGAELGRACLPFHSSPPADALIPLPLFPKKEKQRGYNQARLIAEGMGSVLGVPVWNQVIARTQATQTQTRKGRLERWKNIDGKFELKDPASIHGKRLILVDDVVTTGATLDACGNELLKAHLSELHLAVLALASH